MDNKHWLTLNGQDFEPEMADFTERLDSAEDWNPGTKMLWQAASVVTKLATDSLPIADCFAVYAIDWEFEGQDLPVGELDITLYRDDLNSRKGHPTLRKTEIPFDITDLTIILVDDVLFTGRTIRAAMDGLIDLGRPSEVQLAVLVDRGHRQLPIKATYVGKNLPTALNEQVEVFLEETGEPDRVVIISP